MKSIIRIIAVCCVTLSIFTSCKKDKPSYNNDAKGTVTVEFDNIVGSSDLILDNGVYLNHSGEKFSVTSLKYYVSNFIFTNADGKIYTVPQDESYFLINEKVKGEDGKPRFQIPEGEYTQLTFTLGVDSLRNTMDIDKRTGVLDPAGSNAGMYWGWNSGYIFFILEGTSPSSQQSQHTIQYHIGGFGGYSSPTINNVKTITLDLKERGSAIVKSGNTSNIHLMANILKVFDGVSAFTIEDHSTVMFDTFSVDVANNYATMFAHDHTEN